jgi:hypothetical protein
MKTLASSATQPSSQRVFGSAPVIKTDLVLLSLPRLTVSPPNGFEMIVCLQEIDLEHTNTPIFWPSVPAQYPLEVEVVVKS